MGQERGKPLTLLDLTSAVIEVSADDREAVATLAHLIQSGRVRVVRRRALAKPHPEARMHAAR